MRELLQLRWLLPLVAACALVVPADAQVSLTILHNNDAESELIGSGDFGGAAAFKAKMDQLSAEASGAAREVVKLTSGDNFIPSLEFDASLESFANGGPFYDAEIVEAIGYDALAIGNHDFDAGPDVLADLIGEVGGSAIYLSANLDFANEPNLLALVPTKIAKSTVVMKGGVPIGIIGATTPNLPFISSPRNTIIDPDVASVVQAEVDALTASGVDIIILISHLQGVDEDIALIGQLNGVDIAIAGGGDELLANPGDLLIPGDEADIFDSYPILVADASNNDVPVVTTSGQMFYVGRLNVDFDAAGNVIPASVSGGPVRVAKGGQADAVVPDAFVQTNFVDPIIAFLADLASQIIGSTNVPLDGRRSQVRSVETNMGNLVTDAFVWQARQLLPDNPAIPDNPLIGVANGGGIRNDNIVPTGDLNGLFPGDVLPFGNTFAIVADVTPEALRNVIENSVSRVDNNLGATGGGTGRFAQVSGIKVEYDPRLEPMVIAGDEPPFTIVEPGNRVRSIRLDDGTPIVMNGLVVPGAPNVNAATLSFTAAGGDQYPWGVGSQIFSLNLLDQLVLRSFIEDGLGGRINRRMYMRHGGDRVTELAPPACELLEVILGPPKQIRVRVQDGLSGVVGINPLIVDNAMLALEGGSPLVQPLSMRRPDREDIVVVATKDDPSLLSIIAIEVTDHDGNSRTCDPVVTTLLSETPAAFRLDANYPNPFNPVTRIVFAVPEERAARLAVYDALGREVMVLLDKTVAAGTYEVALEASGLPSGLYFYRLDAGEFSQTRKMMLLK